MEKVRPKVADSYQFADRQEPRLRPRQLGREDENWNAQDCHKPLRECVLTGGRSCASLRHCPDANQAQARGAHFLSVARSSPLTRSPVAIRCQKVDRDEPAPDAVGPIALEAGPFTKPLRQKRAATKSTFRGVRA